MLLSSDIWFAVGVRFWINSRTENFCQFYSSILSTLLISIDISITKEAEKKFSFS
jgi:hypothetical protein